jgi:tetratricopeptide (TPR) repeat protein
VAGGLLIVVIIALGYPVLTRDSNGVGGAGGAAPPGMGGGGSELLDLTQMSQDSLATLLFNRVMMSNSTGDTADVEFFLPKAFTIYEQLNPTDPDGLYHFALLHLVAQDYEAALAKAAEGLDQVPTYLLLLAVSGEAAAALGDSAAAREFYSRYVDQYDTEMALLRPGYEHHQPIFPQYLSEARAFLGQG